MIVSLTATMVRTRTRFSNNTIARGHQFLPCKKYSTFLKIQSEISKVISEILKAIQGMFILITMYLSNSRMFKFLNILRNILTCQIVQIGIEVQNQ